jgi:hypothetical protein
LVFIAKVEKPLYTDPMISNNMYYDHGRSILFAQ